nr:BNR repeat-containing protein [uncultured Draconibacterium sp.]
MMIKIVKHICSIALIVFAIISFVNCSVKTSGTKVSDSPKITEEILIDLVWVANKVSFALQTVGNKQFVAYYDKNRMMTVASREIGSSDWQKTTLPNKLHWDSHNYVAMGIDKQGYIHVSGNMHVNPLVYFRSEYPYDISSMLELNEMTGMNEQRVTYPKFFYNKEGDLLYSYRSGSCGNGNILVKRFLPEQKEWEVYLKEPLFEGVEANDDRAAYHQFVKDSEGNFHFLWIWRWTPMVETSHQICYATTPDLINWKNAAGEEISLPHRPDDEKLIVDPTPTKGGMSNARYRIILTPDEKPLAGYVKYDEEGLTQFYLAHFKNGKWVSKQISNWDFRWQFVEGGDQMTMGGVFDFIGFSEEGLLGIDWKTETGKSGRYVINPETLELVDEEVHFPPAYPKNINDRITNHPQMSVNIQNGRSTKTDGETKYLLKWESMGKSHGRHAPDVIPDGPISPLKLIAFE